MAKKQKRFKTVAEFVRERSGAPWDDVELAEVILAEAPKNSDLYDAADQFLGAISAFEQQLRADEYDRG